MTDTVTYLWTIQWSWVTFIMGYNGLVQKKKFNGWIVDYVIATSKTPIVGGDRQSMSNAHFENQIKYQTW